jgi:hypothetical protein
MPLTSPYRWQWFCFDEQMEISVELMQAYDWPDYPGVREGVGMWTDLFTDVAREYPLGRLWTNGVNATGLLHVEREDALEYTIVALRIRAMLHDGKTPQETFDALVEEYTAGPVYQGDLAGIEDPDQPDNEEI